MKVHGRYEAIDDDASRETGERLVGWLRDYGEHRINSRLMDERRTVPPQLTLDFGRQGIFGIQVGKAHGGLGLRAREVGRILEQTAALDLALGTFLLVCLGPGIRPLVAFGNDDHQREVLPELAAGRMLAGYAQTEPGAGTDFASMAASAVAVDGGWRVRGDKIWIGNAPWAGILTVMAQEIDTEGRRKGITAFAVPTDRRGVVHGRELLSMGMRNVVQAEVAFRDVAVGPNDVLGRNGRGLEVGVDSMSWSRFLIAATCIGAMKRCVQLTARFAGRRRIATGPLGEHPVALAYLGESLAQIACAESLLYEAAAGIDAGEGVAAELFAAAKLVASEFVCEVADRTMQLLGSRGYDESNLVPQLVRDARVTRIFEGASEPLQAFIGAWALRPNSELYALLRGPLDSSPLADELLEALGAAQQRGWPLASGDVEPLPRPWLCALAGSAGVWALMAGLAARERSRNPSPASERTAAWAAGRFAQACGRAREAGVEEVVRLDPPDLDKALDDLAASIGDVEQQLPGERRGLDPLLRRDPPTE